MPVTTTGNQVEVARALQSVLLLYQDELQVAGVIYGRTPTLIPEFPSITVENSIESRGEGETHRWRIDFTVFINIIYGKLQSGEVNQEEAELLAQSVKNVLHLDKKLGGLVVFGYVTRIEPVILRSSEFLRSMRLTWIAQSREVF